MPIPKAIDKMYYLLIVANSKKEKSITLQIVIIYSDSI